MKMEFFYFLLHQKENGVFFFLLKLRVHGSMDPKFATPINKVPKKYKKRKAKFFEKRR